MVGFEYKYTTSSDIMSSIKLITDYSILEYGILIASIIFIISTIYYIIPIINVFLNFRKQERQKLSRKETIRKIALQKDINEEIEKELKI